MDKNKIRCDIASVVVLYNPTIENLNNIKSFIKEVNILFAIDNSAKPKTATRDFLTHYSKVQYLPQIKNSNH